MKLAALLLVTVFIAPIRAAFDRPHVFWNTTVVPYRPLNWWRSVNFQSCGMDKACPTGYKCTLYDGCSEGVCKSCVDPYYPIVNDDLNFLCYKATFKVNAGCTKRWECDDLSTCTLGSNGKTCACPAGSMANSDNTLCVTDPSQTVKLGISCVSDWQCGDWAQCGSSGTGVCRCYDSYQPDTDGKNCVPLRPGDQCQSYNCPSQDACPGAWCNEDGEYTCLPDHQYTYAIDMGPVCVPNSGKVNQPIGSYCSYNAPYTSICDASFYCDVCPGNSYGTCTGEISHPAPAPTPAPIRAEFKRARVFWNTTVAPYNPLNWWRSVNFQSCGTDKACPDGYRCSLFEGCNEGLCYSCVDPYYPIVNDDLNFLCYKATFKVNAECTKRWECDDQSTCTLGSNGRKTCACPLGSIANSDSTLCVTDPTATLTLGSPCVSDWQCGDFAQCGSSGTGVCRCFDSYQPDTDSKKCVPLRPGDQCQPYSCPSLNACPGAWCNDGVYTCLPDHQYTYSVDMGPVCVPNSGKINQPVGSYCSYNTPYTNVCDGPLYCDMCPGSSFGTCTGTATTHPVPQPKETVVRQTFNRDHVFWNTTTAPWVPVRWWEDVNFPTCGTDKACPTGYKCNVYPPCNQGWCEECVDPYYPVVNSDASGKLNFICYKATFKVNAGCTKRWECDDLSTCTLSSDGRKTCACPLGTVANSDNTLCVANKAATLALDSACTTDWQCGDFAQCGISGTGTCRCFSAYRPAADGINCVPLQPGDQCLSYNCPTPRDCPGAWCNSDGEYSCLPGYDYTYSSVDLGPVCVPSSGKLNKGVGDYCSYKSPFTNVCDGPLYCNICPENNYGSCTSDGVITSVTPKSTNDANSMRSYASLLVVAVLLLALI